MSWILLLVYCGLFLFLIHKLDFFRLEGIPKWMTQSFFMAKILAGIALWAVYTFYYPDRSTADIWKYFDDGKVMRDAARESPADFLKMLSGFGDGDPRIHASYYSVMQHWDLAFDQDLPNEAHTLIRWNSLLHFISMGNYHIHSVFMCFLSFIGLCALYRTFYSAFQHHNKIAAAIIFLFPSLLFWSSGVLKEGLVVFALGFLLYNAFLFLSGKRIIHFAIVVIMLLLLFLTRFYVLFALIPALAGALWVHHNEKRAWLKFSIVLFACLALGWAVKFIQPEYDLLRVIALKQNDFLRLARGGTVLFDDDTVAYVEPGFRDRVFERNGNWHIQENTPVTYYHIATDFKDTVRAYHKY
ncbi:MAG TPA: hypothetical protein VI731_05405, partial [Bacteroidia bacterium]|nr:hypothetical protein [Bacteroidia bacterium]